MAKPTDAAPEAPPLPPKPLLTPAPKPLIAPKAAAPARVVPKGFALPSQTVLNARRAATGARDTINRIFGQLAASVAQLKSQLANHATGEEAQDEWEREGVSADAATKITAELEAFLKQHSA